MERIEEFQIGSGDGRRFTVISSAGQRAQVEGVHLEAQFRCALGFLLIATDDVPFEEVLRFTLLDERLSVMDNLCLGQIYRPGIFKLLRSTDPNRLEFSFFGAETWQLEILMKPSLQLLPTPFAVAKYRHGWLKSHHLKLSRVAEG